MANEMVTLLAKARKLGVDGYRKMSIEELRAAIKSAETGAKPAKGKTIAKGKTTASANGRTASKGKSTSTPAKGKSSPAKGRTKSTSKTAPAKSTRKATSAKGKTKAATGAKAKRSSAARGSGRWAVSPVQSGPVKPLGKGKAGTRAALGKINWNKPSNVGQSGKRKDVLDALREHKGDKAAAFKSLKRKAQGYYPGKTKEEAERTLVWLIARVAYDYAYKTGQHEPAQRAAYGTSKRASDIKRREDRAAARKPSRSRKTAGKGRSKAAPAKGRKTAPTASKGRSKSRR